MSIFDPITNRMLAQTFDSRADWIARLAEGYVAEVGKPYWVGGLPFIGLLGATETGLTGLVPHPRFNYDPGHYGADYTGATDSQPAFQACVTAANGVHKISTSAGTLRLDSRVVVAANYQKPNLGQTIIDASNFEGFTNAASALWDGGRNRAVFEFRGVQGPTTLLTADADDGDTTIAVASTAGLAVGMGVELRSSGQLWYTYAGATVVRHQIARIAAISGSNVTLDQPIRYGFSTSGHTVTVQSWAPIVGAGLTGGRLIGGGVRANRLNGFGPVGVLVEGFEDCSVTGTRFEGFQNKAVVFSYGVDPGLSKVWMQGLADTYTAPIVENENAGFYGLWSQFTRGGLVEKVTGSRTRHTVDGFYCHALRVKDCDGIRNHLSTYTTHEGGDGWIFDNVKSDATVHYPMQWRGLSVTVINSDLRGQSELGTQYGFTDLAGSASDVPRDYVFSNFKTDASRTAMLFTAGNYNSITIDGCDIAGCKDQTVGFHPIFIQNTGSLKVLRITNGSRIATLRDANGVCVYVGATAMLDADSIIINQSTLEGYDGTVGALLIDAAGTSRDSIQVAVTENTLMPVAGGSVIAAYAGRASGLWRLGPNYRADGAVWGGETGIKLGNYADGDLSVLDWFEEGAFTPALLIGGAATGITYSVQNAYFIRVGRLVTFGLQINLTSKGALTGALTIGGLPFPNTTLAASGFGGYMSNVNAALGDATFSGRIAVGASAITLFKMVAGVATAMDDTDITDTTTISITSHYRVNE